jgi:hypothetical protein
MELRVTPWEYSGIMKNAADKTEGEFVEWLLEKYPVLHNHLFEIIEVVVDYENGSDPAVWQTVDFSSYVLDFRTKPNRTNP